MSESIVNEVKRNISVVGVSTGDSLRQNGDKNDLVNDISEAIEAEYRRMEAEYQENVRKDWLLFKCHALEPVFSKASYDISKNTGELFSKIRCEAEAKSILREVYDEAVAGLDAKILFGAAVDEIMGFVQGCFEEEKRKVKNCLSGSAFDELERILDVGDFRDEIEEKVKNMEKVKQY